MEQSIQCLKKISFVAYGYEAEDVSFGVTASAKAEFVNGLVLFLSKVKSICPSGHGTGCLFWCYGLCEGGVCKRIGAFSF